MNSRQTRTIGAALLGLFISAAVPAFGGLSATATISAVPDGPNFDYTVLLKNTGTTNIGTFWFAWTPPEQPIEYDFLPHDPISANQPDGWYGIISDGFPGTSVEYYDYLGNPIVPGQTGEFDFTSPDSPTDLKGKAFGLFPITESFIYEGEPEVGTASQVNPAFVVPEPSSLALLGIGGVALLRRRRISV